MRFVATAYRVQTRVNAVLSDRARRRGVSGLEDRERRELQVSEGDIDVPDFLRGN